MSNVHRNHNSVKNTFCIVQPHAARVAYCIRQSAILTPRNNSLDPVVVRVIVNINAHTVSLDRNAEPLTFIVQCHSEAGKALFDFCNVDFFSRTYLFRPYSLLHARLAQKI